MSMAGLGRRGLRIPQRPQLGLQEGMGVSAMELIEKVQILARVTVSLKLQSNIKWDCINNAIL